MHCLGIDIGSVSAKFVVLDGNREITDKVYLKNRNIIHTVKQGLQMLRQYDISGVGVTGSGREFAGKIVGADIIVSEIIAHGTASINLFSDVRTIVDIGGEDSKLILIKNKQVDDFVMNTDCGGGTGAMIEAVCQRLGVEIEKAGEISLTSKAKLTLPSKCGVFCQSAIVSRKNMGVPANDILMAVSRGLVSNYLATLGKRKEFLPPIMFQGACAKNQALVKAFEEELRMPIIVPDNCEFMGAIGAALLAPLEKKKFKGIDRILSSNLRTVTEIATGCSNNCELIRVCDDQDQIAVFGNRCDKCLES